MWRDTVNKALRKSLGYELRKAGAPAAGSGASAEQRAQIRSLKAEIRELEQSRRDRRAEAQVRHRARPTPRLAEQTLAAIEGVPYERLGLTDIANLEATDKGTVGPSPKWPAHNYTDVYEAYLSGWRQKPITILEIGLGVPGDNWNAKMSHGRNEGGGGSLRMWYGYFPHATIHGADINPAPHLDNDRITTHVLDQGDPDAIAAFLDGLGDVEFDLVVDDGSHRPDHQQVSLGCIFPRVRSGGLYIIEDLLTNGKGDGGRGRMASDDVLNTRSVLKSLKRHGELAEPHAIPGSEYVVAHAESVTFHISRRRWTPDTEAVCAIRKA
jgi:hypothetical protein